MGVRAHRAPRAHLDVARGSRRGYVLHHGRTERVTERATRGGDQRERSRGAARETAVDGRVRGGARERADIARAALRVQDARREPAFGSLGNRVGKSGDGVGGALQRSHGDGG